MEKDIDTDINVDRLVNMNKIKRINNTSIKLEILLRTLKRVRDHKKLTEKFNLV